MQLYDQDHFESEFEKNFMNLGLQTYNKYSFIIKQYQKNVIPFEKKRMSQNQNLIFENSSLEKNKMELLGKIQKIMAENHRYQNQLEIQSNKINQLQRKVQQLQTQKQDHLETISQLRNQVKQLSISLNMKIQTIKIVQLDKQQMCQKYQQRNNDYNILLANYMKDKGQLAQRLNAMNQLQYRVLQKQKQLKAQQFYLKKQWEQLQEQKLKSPHQKQKQKQRIPFNKQVNKNSSNPNSNKNIQQGKQQQSKDNKKIDVSRQILKTPIKKIYKHHQSQIYSLSFNYNGSILASCGGDRCIKIYDILNMRNGITIQSNSPANIFESAVLNYGGQKILTGGTDKTVSIFNTSNTKALHSFVGHGQKVNSVTWSSTRQKCASGSQDRQIKIWQIQKASNLLSISCGKSVKYITANTIQPVIYSGHSDGSVRIYSMTQGKTPIAQIKGIIDYPINCISLMSNRYQALVSSTQGSTIFLLDMKMNKAIEKFQHKDFFNTSVHADISPSENYVVAGNCDGSIYYWNVPKRVFQKKISGHEGPVNVLKYNFMSATMASADKQGNLILWQ